MWNSESTFKPFLDNRVKAARMAFRPLLALAADKAAPLAEIYEVMKAKVERTLFYGAMLTFMADEARATLDALQVDFGRQLLGAPRWHHGW